MRRGTCGTFDVEAAAIGRIGGGWCLKDKGHDPPCYFGPVQDEAPLTLGEAAKIVRSLDPEEHPTLTLEQNEALETLCRFAEDAPARLPRLLEPGEEITPGCTASLVAAIVAGPAGVPMSALRVVPSRAFSPHGRTSEQIATAAGVAAREICAEREPGAGAVVEVRLVRRGGGAA